jgi:hypothetical protein
MKIEIIKFVIVIGTGGIVSSFEFELKNCDINVSRALSSN